MASVPADLKPISPYLARAGELAKADPAIAYWCNYYAIQQAMTLGSKAPESNAFLFALMDKLELMKVELAHDETVTDDAAAAAYVENFADKVFMQADNEDRTGKATRLTAKKFVAAANFLDLLSVFGEMSSENRDKIKYSKWKASDIAKALREGRTPVPGPAGGLPVEEEPVSGQFTSEEANELARELAALGTTEEQQATTQSTTTTPAVLSPAKTDDIPASYPFPQQPTTAPSSILPTAPPEFDDEEPTIPAFPSFLNTPTNTPGSVAATSPEEERPAPVIPPSHQTQTLAPPSHFASSAFPAAVFPSAPPLPPAQPSSYFPSSPPPPIFKPPPPQPRVYAAPPPPSAPITVPETLDPSAIAAIQKHAKWAISALNYDDLETARKELRAALVMLG